MIDFLYSLFWISITIAVYLYSDFQYFMLSVLALWLLLYKVPLLFGLEPMSGNDSLFLMDNKTNKLLVTSIAIFSEKISVKQYKKCARKALSADKRVF